MRTTDSRHASPIFPNLYHHLILGRPHQVGAADFTYNRVATCFCYLAVILQPQGRRRCAVAASGYGIGTRGPARGYRPEGWIHHIDRCCQYASQRYRDALEAAGLRGSISSVGNPYHIAQAESFMKTLKVEEIYRAGYETADPIIVRTAMTSDSWATHGIRRAARLTPRPPAPPRRSPGR